MVAKRNCDTVRYQRTSALFVLANARIWASEGWQVTITNAEGQELAPAEFEQSLTAPSPSRVAAAEPTVQEVEPA
jgi:hypothetical protein